MKAAWLFRKRREFIIISLTNEIVAPSAPTIAELCVMHSILNWKVGKNLSEWRKISVSDWISCCSPYTPWLHLRKQEMLMQKNVFIMTTTWEKGFYLYYVLLVLARVADFVRNIRCCYREEKHLCLIYFFWFLLDLKILSCFQDVSSGKDECLLSLSDPSLQPTG